MMQSCVSSVMSPKRKGMLQKQAGCAAVHTHGEVTAKSVAKPCLDQSSQLGQQESIPNHSNIQYSDHFWSVCRREKKRHNRLGHLMLSDCSVGSMFLAATSWSGSLSSHSWGPNVKSISSNCWKLRCFSCEGPVVLLVGTCLKIH